MCSAPDDVEGLIPGFDALNVHNITSVVGFPAQVVGAPSPLLSRAIEPSPQQLAVSSVNASSGGDQAPTSSSNEVILVPRRKKKAIVVEDEEEGAMLADVEEDTSHTFAQNETDGENVPDTVPNDTSPAVEEPVNIFSSFPQTPTQPQTPAERRKLFATHAPLSFTAHPCAFNPSCSSTTSIPQTHEPAFVAGSMVLRTAIQANSFEEEHNELPDNVLHANVTPKPKPPLSSLDTPLSSVLGSLSNVRLKACPSTSELPPRPTLSIADSDDDSAEVSHRSSEEIKSPIDAEGKVRIPLSVIPTDDARISPRFLIKRSSRSPISSRALTPRNNDGSLPSSRASTASARSSLTSRASTASTRSSRASPEDFFSVSDALPQVEEKQARKRKTKKIIVQDDEEELGELTSPTAKRPDPSLTESTPVMKRPQVASTPAAKRREVSPGDEDVFDEDDMEEELDPIDEAENLQPPSAMKDLCGALGTMSIEKPRRAKSEMSYASYRANRDKLAAELFAKYNATIFMSLLPADMAVTWGVRLNTTAGRTFFSTDKMTGQRKARIELSAKVLDSYEKLESTLCHEMCHAAAWLIDGCNKPPHGAIFMKWGARGPKPR